MNLNSRTLPAVLLFIIGIVLINGCGQTFRPTIIPVVKPGGDPSNLGQAVVLSTNPAGNGSNMHIDTSGDTNVGIVAVGSSPAFLAKGGSRALAVNGDSTATLYIALLPTSSAISTVVLPASTSGQVAAGVGVNGNLYIANGGSNDVTVIPSIANVANAAVPVGTQPVAIAGVSGGTGPGADKIYVANHGSNNVTVFSVIDNSFIKTIAVGSQPIWAVMSTDTSAVYIVNQGDGTVSVIDTGIDSVITTIPVGASPNFAFFDPHLKRVYVTSTGSSTLSVIKGDTINLALGIVPTKIADVTLSGAAVSVTALSDGTRAYAALGGCPSGTNHTNLVSSLASCTGNRVSVIDVVALRETKTITVGSGAVSVDAANDASRVYSVNANDRNVSIIRTAVDAELQRMPAPQRDFTCTTSCALQTPFMVRVFP
jgi:YVTN family beta-propeller protein